MEEHNPFEVYDISKLGTSKILLFCNQPKFTDLAHYNAERQRGLQHTPEWVARMKLLQAEYNSEFLDMLEGKDP